MLPLRWATFKTFTTWRLEVNKMTSILPSAMRSTAADKAVRSSGSSQ